MRRKLYKELWNSRFEKMMKLESKAVTDYQRLLDDCRSRLPGHSILAQLEKLIIDEKKHTALVGELIKILERQKD